MKHTYRVGSLFAGVGGICLGFMKAQSETAEFELAWANEIDRYACETYRKNFPHSLFEGDINRILDPELEGCPNGWSTEYYQGLREKLLAERIDILTGGFPCQAFSIAGERKGFEDERGNLFLSIIRLVKMLDKRHGKPRVLFLENVKNLYGHDHGRTYRIIKSEIEKLGYTVKERVINTMDVTEIPQNRERIYIICFLNKEDAERFTAFDGLSQFKRKFSKSERAQQTDSIVKRHIKAPLKYYYSKDKFPNYFMTPHEFESARGQIKGNRINIAEELTEQSQFYQVRRGMYVRKNKSNVCPTLTANMGTGGHNVPLILDDFGFRKITPTEAFLLQGFPIGDGYELPSHIADTQLYKQSGNAVSVPVITLLAEELLKALEG